MDNAPPLHVPPEPAKTPENIPEKVPGATDVVVVPVADAAGASTTGGRS
ncbi:hypothetical protein L917_14087 [Phytophthora nicotianae]|uniref:Uncharacterized protein n=1 Tax=Phytophthora nicotianae TaxID=4792 RepID=W2KMP0_PHYNI|nr:hypothetical protein L917_14087 [Phytophthora nicotianae]